MDSTTKRGYAKPRQEALQKEINLLEADLNCLVTKRDVLGYEEGMDRKITGLRKKNSGKTAGIEGETAKRCTSKSFTR